MKQTKTKNKVFVIGDIHGDPRIMNTTNFPEGNDLTKDDIVFQVGDWGIIWDREPSKEELYWMDWVAQKPWTTFVILGNHENYDRIMELPVTTKNGARCWEYETPHGSIFFPLAGEVVEVDKGDKVEKFLCIRGAVSIDKAYRTPNVSWWEQETLSHQEETDTLNKLDSLKWKVDYVLTHTCPAFIIHEFLDCPSDPKFHDPVSKFFDAVSLDLDFKEWHFGHFHCDRIAPEDPFFCHFKNIREIK